MEKFLKSGHEFLKIICMFILFILLMIPGVLYAATYYSDTDGDGYTETITTTSTAINIYHPRTGSTSSYSYYHGSYPYNESFSISAIADTDGQPGNEIIIVWKATHTWIGGPTYVDGQGIDVIHAAKQQTSGYALGNNTSIQLVRDYEKIAGAEICLYDYSYSRYELITDRTSSIQTTTTCTNTDPNQPPVVAIVPPTGSSYAGYAQKFTAVYSDANGANTINGVDIGWGTNLYSSLSNAIILYYDRVANNLYLVDNAGAGFLGPCKPGSQNTISNSQGTLNCAQTSVALNGTDLTINWNITPKTTFRGTKNMYFDATDATNLYSGIIQKNTWTIY
jgi:hypothetical protein